MTQKSFTGAAAATTLTADCGASDTVLSVAATTGWPNTAVGPFVITIDKGAASEEKVLCSSFGATSVTVSGGVAGRGYDNTTAQRHSNTAPVIHSIDATTVQEANSHVNNTTRDDHTQYLNATRHDVDTRHTFGGAFDVPATPQPIGTAGAGTAVGPARADHVHAFSSSSTSYSPTLGGMTIGNGSVHAHYSVVGVVTFVTITVVAGSTTSVSGAITVTTPSTAANVTGEALWCQMPGASQDGYAEFSTSTVLAITKSDGTSLQALANGTFFCVKGFYFTA